jgi:hypothetical protein
LPRLIEPRVGWKPLALARGLDLGVDETLLALREQVGVVGRRRAAE